MSDDTYPIPGRPKKPHEGPGRLSREWKIDGRVYRQTIELPHIVCLTGSTRFYKEYQRVNYELTTFDNYIVLTVGFYPHAQEEVHGGDMGVSAKQKEALDRLHLKKIDLADEVFVINVDQYIGDSTMSEIAYAIWKRKKIRFLEEPLGGFDSWVFNNRHRLGKLVAGHAGRVGFLRNVEQTITLDQDIEGLGKAGDKVPMSDLWDWAATKGFELGYHKQMEKQSEAEAAGAPAEDGDEPA